MALSPWYVGSGPSSSEIEARKLLFKLRKNKLLAQQIQLAMRIQGRFHPIFLNENCQRATDHLRLNSFRTPMLRLLKGTGSKMTESVPMTSSSSMYDRRRLPYEKKKYSYDYRPNTICMNALASFVSSL